MPLWVVVTNYFLPFHIHIGLLGNFRGPALLNLRPSDSPGEITEGLRQAVGNNCVPIFLSSY